MNDPKYGEIKCQEIIKCGTNKGNRCTNGVYFKCGIYYLCGVHSKNKERVELQKMTKLEKDKIKQENEKDMILNIRYENKIELIKINGMFCDIPIKNGYLDIYPNFKSNWQSKKGGINLPELSPMSLGPVVHNQPNVPIAQNLENFWQGSKYYDCEDDESFVKNRNQMFNDIIPHRYKFSKDIKSSVKYFVWFDIENNEYNLTYIQSRQLYCTFYERLVKNKESFNQLKKLYDLKVNIRIIGPDAYEFDSLSSEAIENAYLDNSKPFGHERVLIAMLILLEEEYPWKKHKTLDF